MSFEPQYKFRCYCGSKGGCFGMKQNYRTTKTPTSSTSSTPTTYGARKRTSNEKFIKIRKSTRDGTVTSSNKHGLGHSYSTSNSCFSRRNSVNSLGSELSGGGSGSRIHFAPDSSGVGGRRVSIDSFASTINSETAGDGTTIWSKKSMQNADADDYTERRRCYERSKIFFQIDPELQRAQNRTDDFIMNLNNVQSKLLREIPTNDVIAALQRFRLDNPDDCFNIYRQNDLKMERRLSECSSSSLGSGSSLCFVDVGRSQCCCACKCCALNGTKAPHVAKVPKKVLKTDGKKSNGDKKFQPLRPLDKSLALRFQSF